MSGIRLARPPLLGAAKTRAQEQLIEWLSEGITVTEACKRIGVMPQIPARWAREDAEFGEAYKQARIDQCQALADDALAVARRPAATIVDVKNKEVEIDTIKWYTSKVSPRQWGDKVQHDHTVLRGVVVLPPLDYSQQPIPALRPEDQVKTVPPGDR
jgi:hypothetical protein